MAKVYIVGNDAGVTQLFRDRNHEVLNISNPLETAELLPDPELVVFTGGSDVWPGLYGKKNTHSSCDVRRDLEEVLWYHRFYHVRKLGICRGGQFLNVCNGGSMEQDAPHHALAGTHNYYDNYTGDRYSVTSTHHQIMKGVGSVFVVGVSFNMPDGRNTHECLYYAQTKSLCFQPHPEYGRGEEGNDTVTAMEVAMRTVWKKVY